MPDVSLVDMREELQQRKSLDVHQDLMAGLEETPEKGEQAGLFLNNRGYSSFVMCRDCGYVIAVPALRHLIDVSPYGQRLQCHYCGYETGSRQAAPNAAASISATLVQAHSGSKRN